MARAYSQFPEPDYGSSGQDQWQDLRDELVSLLDQVEGEVSRNQRREPALGGLGQRLRDLRAQIEEAPDGRQREGLRSAQRTVNRFNERDEGPVASARDTLDAAIRQIRSRQYGHPSAPYVERRAAPQFDEMAHAVDGIAERLERLEVDLTSHSKGQTANTKEIADQLGQLSHVVELLAGAVGETGQVKRLEAQIGSLAKLIARGAQTEPETLVRRFEDLSTTLDRLAAMQQGHSEQLALHGRQMDATGITARLDDVSATVGRLADLQVQHAARSDTQALTAKLDEVSQTIARLNERQEQIAEKIATEREAPDNSEVTERLDDVAATIGRLAELQIEVAARMDEPRDEGLKRSMQAIEAGLRNVYDRIDAIERSTALPQPELEKITEQLRQVSVAMQSPSQPQGLIELIDALNVRISDIESSNSAVGGLKSDMETLRQTVADAIEPRFAALETRLGALSQQLEERPESAAPQIEGQVRQLVARMDQTGEQLSDLAKLYAKSNSRELPDFDQLADLVAQRTSDALGRQEAPTGLDEAGLSEIESRVARLLREAGAEGDKADMVGLATTIREVGDRLSRLEDMLSSASAVVAPASIAPAAPMLSEALDAKAKAAVEASLAFDDPVEDEPVDNDPAPADFADLEAEMAALRPIALEPLDDDDDTDPLAPLVAPRNRRSAPGDDPMPADPSAEAPLVAKSFADPAPRAEMPEPEFAERKPAPAAREPETPLNWPTGSAAGFDVSQAERPPRPVSSLEAGEDAERAEAPATPNRNTFIEAHRRAARQAAGATRQQTLTGDSLIGRAFARFNAARPPEDEDEATAPAPETAEVAAETERKPRLWDRLRQRRRLAGDDEPAEPWTPRDEEGADRPVAPEPSTVAMDAEASTPAEDQDEDGEGAAKESFLSRNRRPILLGLSVVALACLTLNFVSQRMKEEPAPTATGASVPVEASSLPLSPSPMAETPIDVSSLGAAKSPRVIAGVDQLTTASIDPGATRGFTARDVTQLPAKASTAALAAIEEQVPAVVELPAATAHVASLAEGIAPLSDTLESDTRESDTFELSSPVHVELPPEGIGPLELRQAAADGDVRAQFEVGAIYTEGRAVPEDLGEAFKWYERAANQGYAPAQYRLGNLYEVGRGTKKDVDLARLWYQRAAEAGNRMAMHNLAALYAGGALGKQEFDAAANWFEQAAERGMTDSQFNLGMLNARGLGVAQDFEQSYFWFSIVASKGDADAAKARDDVAASLDAATVRRLNEELAAWTPEPVDLVANFAPIGTWAPNFDPGARIQNKDVVLGVQKALGQLGFDVGQPDGMTGPKTAEAIRSFERATGMSESGEINPRLLAVLGSQPV